MDSGPAAVLTTGATGRATPLRLIEPDDIAIDRAPDPHHLRRTAAALRIKCTTAGIDSRLLSDLLREHGDHGVDDALHFVFADRPSRLPDVRSMQRLAEGVEAILEHGLPTDLRPRTTVSVVAGLVRNLFAGATFAVCAWLVLGAMLTGQNALAAQMPASVGLAVLGVSIVSLALLEAAHIGAVALSGADVSELAESHPRVYRLHRHIASKASLEEYLAGRQAAVVLVVFTIAAVTRTVRMPTLPWTNIPLPRWVTPLLDIGAPGAIMVLVIGQVAPQLITARRPASAMNTLPMAIAFTVTRCIAKIGLANPAYWMVRWSKRTERIPSAARQRHEATTLDVTGFGVESVCRRTVVGSGHSHADTTTVVRINRAGSLSHTLDVASVSTPPSSYASDVRLLRDAAIEPAVAIANEEISPTVDGTHHFLETLAPGIGAFEAGDILRATFAAHYDRELDEERFAVSAPTRLVVVQVIIETPTFPIPPARLTVESAENNDAPSTSLVTPTSVPDSDAVEFVATVRYPDVGSVISLSWNSGPSSPSKQPGADRLQITTAEGSPS